MYIHVKPEDCDEIIEQTIIGGQVIPRLLYELDGKTYAQHSEIPFYKILPWGCLRTLSHFRPAGKPPPPRPRRPESLT